ncbi:hypothetical protein JOB18_048606 [Solea senegalensis]|uniref:Uncharacterized protein n=1 Tax=Solea senegalensis TaxID=28829 RepID=A0AAV6SLN4_SOLSE|nr:hypothetical protein JOB18_048606 [Solea senegalensis]
MTAGVTWYLHRSFKSASQSEAGQDKFPAGTNLRLPTETVQSRKGSSARTQLSAEPPSPTPQLHSSRLHQTLTHTEESRDKEQRAECSLTVLHTGASDSSIFGATFE